MIGEADRLLAATDFYKNFTGWDTISDAILFSIPSFLYPAKPLMATNNFLGHYAGDAAPEDFGTQFSYGFFANWYNAFGLPGVLAGSAITVVWIGMLIGLIATGKPQSDPWYLLARGRPEPELRRTVDVRTDLGHPHTADRDDTAAVGPYPRARPFRTRRAEHADRRAAIASADLRSARRASRGRVRLRRARADCLIGGQIAVDHRSGTETPRVADTGVAARGQGRQRRVDDGRRSRRIQGIEGHGRAHHRLRPWVRGHW